MDQHDQQNPFKATFRRANNTLLKRCGANVRLAMEELGGTPLINDLTIGTTAAEAVEDLRRYQLACQFAFMKQFRRCAPAPKTEGGDEQ
jgi:hypothetical protein